MRLALKIFGGIFIVALILFFAFNPFGAPQKTAEAERLIVQQGETHAQVLNDLKEKGFIKHPFLFELVFRGKIRPGAYKISKSMNVFQMASAMKSDPYMKWVTVPEGLRKEETAELLKLSLGWNDAKKKDFINTPEKNNWPLDEGLFYPDTYLLPKDESGEQIAERMRNKFNEKFSPYSMVFVEQNIKWTTGVRFASLIQREAAGKDDMNLIAGILWNRLDKDMRLELDATLQYVKGNESVWWPQLKSADRSLDSPYNTYRNNGIPPGAISNPGINAILAVLHPQKTDCLFYIHDSSRQIHCAKTYEEHQANIEKYLK